MVSATPLAPKANLMRAVERAFARAGWTVQQPSANLSDFNVRRGALALVIKCLDESRRNYEDRSAILRNVERCQRNLRASGNYQLVVIFDWNFLSVDLHSLIERELFAITVDEIESVTCLASVADTIPEGLDKRQIWLLKRCVDYAINVSKIYHKNGDFRSALRWGHYAVTYSLGVTQAYFWLFNLLRDVGELDAAAELGEKLRQSRPDDHGLIRSMEDLARRRGNLEEAAELRARLMDLPTTPRTFEDIIAKQRQQNPSASLASSPAPAVETPEPQRGIARLFKAFRRS